MRVALGIMFAAVIAVGTPVPLSGSRRIANCGRSGRPMPSCEPTWRTWGRGSWSWSAGSMR